MSQSIPLDVIKILSPSRYVRGLRMTYSSGSTGFVILRSPFRASSRSLIVGDHKNREKK